MAALAKGLVGLAALAFVLAVIAAFLGPVILGFAPESFSRAANNLALIAIGLAVCFKDGTGAG